jgi:hypothetical protein
MNTNSHIIKQTMKILLLVSIALVAAGCVATRPPGEIVEWSEFKLATGVSEDTMLRAADSVHDNFLRKQPGFVRWELLRGKDGKWVNLLYWKNQASVDQAMPKVEKSPACSAYFKCMADSAETVPFFHRVKAYPR